MTKKDYIKIAKIFKRWTDYAVDRTASDDELPLLRGLAADFCEVFWTDNPRFDREKFLKACGLETK